MAAPGDEFSMRLRRAYLSMHRRANANFARYGVTADQFVALTALASRGGLTQQELVRACYSDPNTVRALLERLERQELVIREPHATDRRARVASLTERGRALQRELWAFNESLQNELEGLFEPAELRAFLDGLDRIAHAMTSLPH